MTTATELPESVTRPDRSAAAATDSRNSSQPDGRTPERRAAPGVFEIAAYVWRQWMRERRLFAYIGVGLLFMTLADVGVPYFAGHFVDRLSAEAPAGEVWRALGLLIGITFAFFAIRHATLRLWMHFAARVMRGLVAEAFARVQRFSTDWHSSAFSGATVRKISRGMWAYDSYSDTTVLAFAPAVLTLIGLTLLLTMQWPVMGLSLLVLTIFHMSASVYLATRYVAPVNQRHIEADSLVGAAMADAVTCNATVKSFGAEVYEDQRFGGVIGHWSGRAVRAWTRLEIMVACQNAIQLVMMIGLLVPAVWYWAEGAATTGQVATALTSYFVIDMHLRYLGFHIQHLQQAINELEDLVAFEQQPLGVADRPQAVPFAPGAGAISFRDVRFRYAGQPEPIYERFSLDIAPGERIGLVGRSGAGKSTFVKLLQRLYDVEAGEIRIDGQDIAAVTQGSLRRAIALVPQDPILFHRTLAENIGYARPEASRAEIEAAARRAHADTFIEALPAGYDTLVGERGVKLSGGERQRVALARAFLADAPILVLDEATSSLDSETEHLIQAAIEDLMRDRTTILIAHRLSTIRDVDRILVFEEGRIVEEGTHETLIGEADGHYQRLHALQAGGLQL